MSAAVSLVDRLATRAVGTTCEVRRGAATVRIRSARALVPGWRTLAWWDTFDEAKAGASMQRAIESLTERRPNGANQRFRDGSYLASRAMSRGFPARYAKLLLSEHAEQIRAERTRPTEIANEIEHERKTRDASIQRPLRRTLEAAERQDIAEAVDTALSRKRVDSDAVDEIRQALTIAWLARSAALPEGERIKWLVGVAKNLVRMMQRKRATHRRIHRERAWNILELVQPDLRDEDEVIDFIEMARAFERQWAIDHPNAPPLRPFRPEVTATDFQTASREALVWLRRHSETEHHGPAKALATARAWQAAHIRPLTFEEKPRLAQCLLRSRENESTPFNGRTRDGASREP